MDLAVRQWVALRGIFAPAPRACRSVASLDTLTAAALSYLRQNYGEMRPDEVPRACADHWVAIVQNCAL